MFYNIIRSLALRISFILALEYRIFRNILENNCHSLRRIKALVRGLVVYHIPFAVRHLHIEDKLDFLTRFKVQLFRILHADRIVAHHERNFIIGIDNRVFLVAIHFRMSHIGINSRDNTDRIAFIQFFLRIQSKLFRGTLVILVQIFNFRNIRSFVHINHANGNGNRRIQCVIRISGRLTIVGNLDLNVKQAVCRFIVELCAFLDKDFSCCRINIVQFSDMFVVFCSTSICGKIKREGQLIPIHVRGVNVTIGIDRHGASRFAIFRNSEFSTFSLRLVIYRSNKHCCGIFIFRRVVICINNPKFKIITLKGITTFRTLRQIVILFKSKDKFARR